MAVADPSGGRTTRSEIFPNAVRSFGNSLGAATHWIFAALIAGAFVWFEGAGAERTLEMKRKRHTPEQIIRKLRQAEAQMSTGTTISEVCRGFGVSETTYHRWRKQYGGMKAEEAKRLRSFIRKAKDFRLCRPQFPFAAHTWKFRVHGAVTNRTVARGQNEHHDRNVLTPDDAVGVLD